MAVCWPKRAIHLDFHTMPSVYDVGRDFDADEFARTLKTAGVDYVTVFAKCNLGFAYYPTQVGTVHPGLQADLLGPMLAACHKKDIHVAAYINAGLDHEHALRHREWCKLNAEGQLYEMQTMGHFFRKMCLNTGYGEHLLSMVDEVLANYPIDGLFLDCFTLSPCYGIECLDGMRGLGWDVTNEAEVREYCWRVTHEFTTRVEALVRAKRPGINVYYNGLPYRHQPTHVELEILPTGGWGYDYLPWAIRYARTLGKPYFTMTGRFHGGWGDFGGLRPLHALLYDCYNSIANGGTCSIGDHMHPRGALEPEVYRLIGQVYARTRALDPWTEGVHALAEIAIVEPGLSRTPGAAFDRSSLAGAARILMESKYQFDVCDGEAELTGYQVIVLPDHVLLDAALKDKVRAHLARGGVVISSADAGLDESLSAFALDEWGLTYEGPEPYDPTFLWAGPGVDAGVPRMPIAIYERGVAMRAKDGTSALARLFRPYFNKGSWDWRHENMYMPPESDSGRPALAQSGGVYHFSFPVFKGYYDHAVVAYKTLVRNCIERAHPRPLLKTQNLPSFGQVTLTQRATRRMVHIIAYVPELRGKRVQMIEEPITVGNVGVALLDDDQRVKGVYLAPGREELGFSREQGYVSVTVPQVQGYQMVVFEAG